MAKVIIVPTSSEKLAKLEIVLHAIADGLTEATGKTHVVRHKVTDSRFFDDIHRHNIVAIGDPVTVKRWWGKSTCQSETVVLSMSSDFAVYPGAVDVISCCVRSEAVGIVSGGLNAYADEISATGVAIHREPVG